MNSLPSLKILVPTLGALAVGGAIAYFGHEFDMLEKPKFKLLKVLSTARRGWFVWGNRAEIREYAPFLIAEVEFDPKDFEANPFKGNNTKVGAEPGVKENIAMTAPVRLEMVPPKQPNAEKIAMTAPVRLEMQAASAVTASSTQMEKFKLSFTMPSKYTKETLPRPNNSNVIIKEVPSRVVAVVSTSGPSPREEQVDKLKAELLELLKSSGYRVKPDSSVILNQYHPPFFPSPFRLNEVEIEVEIEP